MLRLGKFRVVELDCPYETWGEPRTRDLFSAMVGLKLSGYQAEYGPGVLPVDASDFICSHQLVCEELGNILRPVMGYRSISATRARFFGLPFFGSSLVRSAGATKHEEALQSILQRCQNTGREISYDSSWTMDPWIRQDPEASEYLRGLMRAMHVLYHVEAEIPEIVAGAVVRFKMERYYHYWGYKELALSGGILPLIQVPTLLNEDVRVFHLERFSEKALADAQQFRNEWNNRILIRASFVPTVRKIAA